MKTAKTLNGLKSQRKQIEAKLEQYEVIATNHLEEAQAERKDMIHFRQVLKRCQSEKSINKYKVLIRLSFLRAKEHQSSFKKYCDKAKSLKAQLRKIEKKVVKAKARDLINRPKRLARVYKDANSFLSKNGFRWNGEEKKPSDKTKEYTISKYASWTLVGVN